MADTPIDNKPAIQAKKAQEYFLNLPKIQNDTYVPKADAIGALATMTGKFAETLQGMQDRNDKLALTNFERKLSSMEKTLALQAGMANTTDEVDNLYNTFRGDVDATAKNMLKGNLYNRWSQQSKTNYYDLTADAMNRAKVPILQREADITITDLIDSSSIARMTAGEEERKLIDENVRTAIDYATYPKDGSLPIYTSTQGNQKYKTYLNKADVMSVSADAEVDAASTMKKLEAGGYSNLSAEQIKTIKPQLKKLVDTQEQENIYEQYRKKNTDPKSGETNWRKMTAELNTQAEKETGAKKANINAATQMAYSTMNRDEQIKKQVARQLETDTYDKASQFTLKGDWPAAIRVWEESDNPDGVKFDNIQKINKWAEHAASTGNNSFGKYDNPEFSTEMARQIVSQEIFDSKPILQAYADGNISTATKDRYLKLLDQVSKPSSKPYKDAMDTVKTSLKSGRFNNKAIDSALNTYVVDYITQEYVNAEKNGATLEEMKTLFSPFRMDSLIKQAVDEGISARTILQKEATETANRERVKTLTTDNYNALENAILTGAVRTKAQLDDVIKDIEKQNPYYNFVDRQLDLEDLLDEMYGKDVVDRDAPREKVLPEVSMYMPELPLPSELIKGTPANIFQKRILAEERTVPVPSRRESLIRKTPGISSRQVLERSGNVQKHPDEAIDSYINSLINAHLSSKGAQ